MEQYYEIRKDGVEKGSIIREAYYSVKRSKARVVILATANGRRLPVQCSSCCQEQQVLERRTASGSRLDSHKEKGLSEMLRNGGGRKEEGLNSIQRKNNLMEKTEFVQRSLALSVHSESVLIIS